MYELTIETGFAAAHCLREYQGSCERLHGHNWRVEISVRAENLDRLGMVKDFRILREEAEKVAGRLDHRYLNDTAPFDKLNPSAENIAKFFFDELSKTVNDGNARVSTVRVWESEKAAAAYHGA